MQNNQKQDKIKHKNSLVAAHHKATEKWNEQNKRTKEIWSNKKNEQNAKKEQKQKSNKTKTKQTKTQRKEPKRKQNAKQNKNKTKETQKLTLCTSQSNSEMK